MQILTHFAVRTGGLERDGSLYPPSVEDVLQSSAKGQSELKDYLGSLIYTVRCKVNGSGKPTFLSAHLDRSKLIPNGAERKFYRAYRQNQNVQDNVFLPGDLAWSHDEKDYESGQALLTAKTWFHSDRSKPALLVEEVFVGNILVTSRSLAVSEGKDEE
jgi:hypothetical protein